MKTSDIADVQQQLVESDKAKDRLLNIGVRYTDRNGVQQWGNAVAVAEAGRKSDQLNQNIVALRSQVSSCSN